MEFKNSFENKKLLIPEDIKIVLLSSSPRRKFLLSTIIKNNFEIINPKKELEITENLEPIEFVKKNSIIKLFSVETEIPFNSIAVSADTIVYCENQVIGKPIDYDDAVRILKILNNNVHSVYTGYSIFLKSKKILFNLYEESIVKFIKYNDEFIKEYLVRFDYKDKAGAYAVQEDKNNLIEYFQGLKSNIMGLPVEKIKIVIANCI